MANFSSFDLAALLEQANKPRMASSTKKPRYSMRNRPRGEDTVMSRFYICCVFDETNRIAYAVGGLGTTEKLVDRLVREGISLREFRHRGHKTTLYDIISKNGRVGYGFRVESLEMWKEIRVIRGTADFFFLLHNTHGRKGVV